MPRSRKRKIKNKKKILKREKVYQPYEVVDHEFVEYSNLNTKDIPFKERLEAVIALASKADEEYEKELKNLFGYLEKHDQIYLCSFAAYYFHRIEEGIDQEAIDGFLEFPAFYLEILQCLAIINSRNKSLNPLNNEVETFKQTIINLNQWQSVRYFNLIKGVKSEEDTNSIFLRNEMMLNTLAVRNWAYVHQMQSITYDLANLSNTKFLKEIGFNPKHLLDVLNNSVNLIEEKLNTYHRGTAKFIKAKSYESTFKEYEKSFPLVNKTSKTEQATIWKTLSKNLHNLKAMLLAHSDLSLHEIYTLKLSEIKESLDSPISDVSLRQILETISLEFEELHEYNVDHIYLDNPIHYKPFLKIEEDAYFSIIPHLFAHTGIKILENIICQNQNLKDDYSSKKGKYLEEKVEQLFKKAFPRAKIFSGSQWNDPLSKKLYENDLLVVIEQFAIVVECKSGGVSPSAQRGAPKRLMRTIKELVQEPSEQAIRFQNYLKQNPTKHSFVTKSGDINLVDSSNIKYYVPLGVTLSHLGSIGCNLKKLIDAKVIDKGLSDLAPSISYTDLEIILDILETSSEKIHYLSRRREFEAHMNFQGDEGDIFGFYLDNGFNIGETEYDTKLLINLTLKSKALDPYYIGKSRNVNVKKPQLKKTKYWSELLLKVEQSCKNWLIINYILLNLPKEDQQKFEKNLKTLTKRILDGKCKKRHNYMILNAGPPRRKYAIVGYPYFNTDKTTRNEIMNDIAASLSEKNEFRGYLILGYNLNEPHLPYSVVAYGFDENLYDALE